MDKCQAEWGKSWLGILKKISVTNFHPKENDLEFLEWGGTIGLFLERIFNKLANWSIPEMAAGQECHALSQRVIMLA